MPDNISVDLIVKAISEGFDKVNRDMQSMSKVGQKSAADLSKSQAKASQQQAEMGTRMSLLTQKHQEKAAAAKQEVAAYNDLAAASAKVAVGFGALAAAGGALLYSSVKLAARTETLGIVTARMGENVGYAEDEIRSLEQSVMDQGITMRSARESISLMIQANLDLANATDLARLAQDAAVVTGQNSSETFRDLIYAISTGNRIMLRRMQLSADFEGAYKREADAIGKSTLALTEAEKVQIRMTEVMARGANIAGVYEAAMETAGKKVASLDRHIEESKRMLGEIWLPVYADVIDFVTDSLKTWEDLGANQQRIVSSTMGYVVALFALEAAAFAGLAAVVKLKVAIAALRAGTAGASLATLGLVGGITALIAVVAILAIESGKAEQARRDEAQAATDVNVEMMKAADSVDAYKNAVQAAYELDGELPPSGAEVDAAKTRFQELFEQFGNLPGIVFDAETLTISIDPSVIQSVVDSVQQEIQGVAAQRLGIKVGIVPVLSMQAGMPSEIDLLKDTQITPFGKEVGIENVLNNLEVYRQNVNALSNLEGGMPDLVSDAWFAQVKAAQGSVAETSEDFTALRASMDAALAGQGTIPDPMEEWQSKARLVAHEAYLEQLKEQDKVEQELYNQRQTQGKALVAFGVSGQLQSQAESYHETLAELAKEEAKIREERDKYKVGTDKFNELNSALAEVQTQQREVAAATQEAIAALIYQQAVASLDAGAALELAQALGLLSMADYAVAKSTADAIKLADENKDGMVTIGNESKTLTALMLDQEEAINRLNEAGSDWDWSDLQDMIDVVMQEDVVGAVDDLAGAMEDVAEATGDVADLEPTGDDLAGVDESAQGIVDSGGAVIDTFAGWNSALEEVKSTAEQVEALIAQKIAGDHVINFTITVTGEVPIPDIVGQHGGSFTVPPGYPNDSYIAGLTSGEQVTVIPAGGAPSVRPAYDHVSGGGSGGIFDESATFLEENNYIISGAGAAALLLAQKETTRRARLNATMGK